MKSSIHAKAWAAMAGAGLGMGFVSLCLLGGWVLLELY
jgi:hypothetical protein